jgi:hypothetical protein
MKNFDDIVKHINNEETQRLVGLKTDLENSKDYDIKTIIIKQIRLFEDKLVLKYGEDEV